MEDRTITLNEVLILLKQKLAIILIVGVVVAAASVGIYVLKMKKVSSENLASYCAIRINCTDEEKAVGKTTPIRESRQIIVSDEVLEQIRQDLQLENVSIETLRQAIVFSDSEDGNYKLIYVVMDSQETAQAVCERIAERGVVALKNANISAAVEEAAQAIGPVSLTVKEDAADISGYSYNVKMVSLDGMCTRNYIKRAITGVVIGVTLAVLLFCVVYIARKENRLNRV